MKRIQLLRDELLPSQPSPASATELEQQFSIRKDGFVTFMTRRLGPLPAVDLLIETPEFAKNGISYEAYKVYVFSKWGNYSLIIFVDLRRWVKLRYAKSELLSMRSFLLLIHIHVTNYCHT